MHMNTKYCRDCTKNDGFTVIELLIVLGVIALLLAVVIASLTSAKDKAADAQVKHVLSDITVKVEEHEIAPGAIDYERAFTITQTEDVVKGLALELRVPDGMYDYIVTGNEYVIVFPLRSGKYWCVDSRRAIGEVGGRLIDDGRSCADATRTTSGGTTIALNGPNPFILPIDPDDLGISRYVEPGATATDAEGNDISSTMRISGPVYQSSDGACTDIFVVTYTAGDSEATRTIRMPRFDCASE